MDSRKLVVALMAGSMMMASYAGMAHAAASVRFAVQDSAGTADKMVVMDNGFVGIGTNTPATAIQTKGTDYPTTQILSHYVGNDSFASGGFLAYRNSLDADGKTPILPKKGQRIGYFQFGSMNSDGTSRNGAGCSGYAENDWTSTSIPAYFVFDTASPTSGLGRIERMRITSTGNIGVGTSTPQQKLEVAGGVRLNTTVAKPACSSTVRGTVWMTQGASHVADALEVCTKDANDAYSWVKLY